MGRRKVSLSEKLEIYKSIEDRGYLTPCWIWTGALDQDGYGKVTYAPTGNFRDGTKTTTAHRAAFILRNGKIDPALTLDHLCRIRSCFNPDHCEPVSNAVNLQRGKGNHSKTHCKSGHPFSGDNLYISPEGFRYCKTCRREAVRKYASAVRKLHA